MFIAVDVVGWKQWPKIQKSSEISSKGQCEGKQEKREIYIS